MPVWRSVFNLFKSKMANPSYKASLTELLSKCLSRIESVVAANQAEVLTVFSHDESFLF